LLGLVLEVLDIVCGTIDEYFTQVRNEFDGCC